MTTEGKSLLDSHCHVLSKRYPLSRTLFITIKDNTNSWKIGKVYDWTRKFSNCFFIVRGTNNGTHYHLIAGVEPNKKPVCRKGIHFHIQNLSENREIIRYEYAAEDARKAIHYRREAFIRQTDGLDTDIVNIITKISKMILSYFESKKRKVKLTAKEERYMLVYNYLEKNLNEPREQLYAEPSEYTDYVYQPKVLTGQI